MSSIKCGFQISEAYSKCGRTKTYIESAKHNFVNTRKRWFDDTSNPICFACSLVSMMTEFKTRSEQYTQIVLPITSSERQ